MNISPAVPSFMPTEMGGIPLPQFIQNLMAVHQRAQSLAPAGQTVPMHPLLHNALQLHLKLNAAGAPTIARPGTPSPTAPAIRQGLREPGQWGGEPDPRIGNIKPVPPANHTGKAAPRGYRA